MTITYFLLIDFWEGEEGAEREIQRHQLYALTLARDQTSNLGVSGQRSNQLSHPVRAHWFLIDLKIWYLLTNQKAACEAKWGLKWHKSMPRLGFYRSWMDLAWSIKYKRHSIWKIRLEKQMLLIKERLIDRIIWILYFCRKCLGTAYRILRFF